MGMLTLLRMAVLAALIVVAQGSLAADGSAEPTRDEKPLANEAELTRVIHETIMPKPLEHRPFPDDVRALLNWSEPVNGLVARIEYIAHLDFCVRLKNVSKRPLKVPTANRVDKAAPRFFEVYVKQGQGSWGPVTGPSRFTTFFADPPDLDEGAIRSMSRSFKRDQVPADRPGVTLQPGEDCIALVSGHENEGNGEPRTVKVVLSRGKSMIPINGGESWKRLRVPWSWNGTNSRTCARPCRFRLIFPSSATIFRPLSPCPSKSHRCGCCATITSCSPIWHLSTSRPRSARNSSCECTGRRVCP